MAEGLQADAQSTDQEPSEKSKKAQFLQQKAGGESYQDTPEPYISFQTGGQVAPNSTLAREHFTDVEAVCFAPGEDEDTLWILLLDEYDEDATDEIGIPDEIDGSFSLAAKKICNKADMVFDQCHRYAPEYDEEWNALKIDKSDPLMIVESQTKQD